MGEIIILILLPAPLYPMAFFVIRDTLRQIRTNRR